MMDDVSSAVTVYATNSQLSAPHPDGDGRTVREALVELLWKFESFGHQDVYDSVDGRNQWFAIARGLVFTVYSDSIFDVDVLCGFLHSVHIAYELVQESDGSVDHVLYHPAVGVRHAIGWETVPQWKLVDALRTRFSSEAFTVRDVEVVLHELNGGPVRQLLDAIRVEAGTNASV